MRQPAAGHPLLLQVVVGSSCRSAGDCLRALDQSGALGGDFVLVCGDVVSNMDLGAVVAEHRARRDTDPNAIMTMVSRPGARVLTRVSSQGTCSWIDALLHLSRGAVELAPSRPPAARKGGAGAAMSRSPG